MDQRRICDHGRGLRLGGDCVINTLGAAVTQARG